MSAADPVQETTPKAHLQGMTLASGWTLVERLDPSKGSTGGTFGIGYKATKGNEIAFVKAIDFVDAISSPDPLAELTKLSAIANFERDVLAYCATKGMSKVLRYIGHEYISYNGSDDPLSRVSCLIMEAGTHDLRRLLNGNGLASCGWNLPVLRDVSLAIAQLHQGNIAHQDIKPSNVIAVREKNLNDASSMKVGDLGRVVRRDQAGPFDSQPWPGDSRYSPPERWYGFVPPDWCDSREAADAYMLGSLLIFLFTGATLQSLVVKYIPISFQPDKWTGRFDDDLLPVLVNAHVRVLHEHLLPELMPEIADRVMDIARALTQPDPTARGDTKARRQVGRPVGIDRIHNKFSELSHTCMAIERGKGKQ